VYLERGLVGRMWGGRHLLGKLPRRGRLWRNRWREEWGDWRLLELGDIGAELRRVS
jgi:hypothetical protein